MKPPILSNAQIEADAHNLIARYERQTGKTVSLPVPIERIINAVLDIPIEWASILPKDGREIVSKVVLPTFGQACQIVMNRDLLATKFAESPGLEVTAMAHEAGHVTYHVDFSKQFQLSLGLEDTGFSTAADDVTSELARRLRQSGPMGDDWWREWQAHTFMRYVLMPEYLIRPLILGSRVLSWPTLYELRAACNVTISALVVHCSRCGYIEVEGKTIRDLRAGTREQLRLSRH